MYHETSWGPPALLSLLQRNYQKVNPIIKEILKILVWEEGENQEDFDDENDSDLNDGLEGSEGAF